MRFLSLTCTIVLFFILLFTGIYYHLLNQPPVTLPKVSFGNNFLYQQGSTLYISRDKKISKPFTSKNDQVFAFVVDKIHNMLYFTTVQNQHAIYSCNLYGATCIKKVIATVDATQYINGYLYISPDTSQLAYEIIDKQNSCQAIAIYTIKTKTTTQKLKNTCGNIVDRLAGWLNNTSLLYAGKANTTDVYSYSLINGITDLVATNTYTLLSNGAFINSHIYPIIQIGNTALFHYSLFDIWGDTNNDPIYNNDTYFLSNVENLPNLMTNLSILPTIYQHYTPNIARVLNINGEIVLPFVIKDLHTKLAVCDEQITTCSLQDLSIQDQHTTNALLIQKQVISPMITNYTIQYRNDLTLTIETYTEQTGTYPQVASDLFDHTTNTRYYPIRYEKPNMPEIF